MDTQGNDEVDGIRHLMKRMGRYNPKKHEELEQGSDAQLSDYEDPDDQIFQLLKATAPDAHWREGLSYMMKEPKEVLLRKTLAFLHNNVAAGINLLDDGARPGTSVECDGDSGAINCSDWMKVMEGLGFDLISPGTVRSIEYVDVQLAEKTNKEAMKGFCCLMHTILELSWTNLQILPKLQKDQGNLLWETVTMLRSGSGIPSSSRVQLEDLEENYPYFMKTLGFLRDGDKLQWEKPKGEFNRLCWSLHGLYRQTDVFESPV